MTHLIVFNGRFILIIGHSGFFVVWDDGGRGHNVLNWCFSDVNRMAVGIATDLNGRVREYGVGDGRIDPVVES